jgi:phosphatidylserine/phosphatidylglycerophosphate/cardiolipin synthase-like enzyme
MQKQQNVVQENANNWWATTDFPVRDMLRAAFLIDGRMTMLEMCIRFLTAQHSITICAWGLTPELLLVRGPHHRAGPDGSPEQTKLLHWLSRQGLDDDGLAFWQQGQELSVKNVLARAASKGVDVRLLLWDAYTLPFQGGAKQICEELERLGIKALADDSSRDLLNHPIQSLHQKAITVDSKYAFIGGIDMMIENDGDFDRWDSKGHSYFNLLRKDRTGRMSHSWHDVHVLFEGQAVADVEQNFRQRWNDVVERHGLDPLLCLEYLPREQGPVESREKIRMQVVRTIPSKTYAFTGEDEGIETIFEIYRKAFRRATKFIYIENQYFWRRVFLGLENPSLLGPAHPEMEALLQDMANALTRGVAILLILPDHPNVGREFTDDGLHYLWELANEGSSSDGLQAYTLGSYIEKDAQCYYRPIYVHSKVLIVDDEWLTLGSANLNNRGMRDDAEINVALYHPAMARGLRILLMAEHLGLSDEDTLFSIVEIMGRSHPTRELENIGGDLRTMWNHLQELLGDPLDALALFASQAKDNLEAVRGRHELTGHLLPYIRHDMAEANEVAVHSVNGWLSGMSLDVNGESNASEELVNERGPAEGELEFGTTQSAT